MAGIRNASVVLAVLALAVASVAGCGKAEVAPAPAPVSATFTVSPKYFIGSVIYMPPGGVSAPITYPTDMVTGTTVSTASSWSSNSSPGPSIGNGNVQFGDFFGGSAIRSVDARRTGVGWTTVPPSSSIDHDYDSILIFLGVKVNAALDSLGNITWSVDFSQIESQGFATSGYPIYVGCLKPTSTVPASYCAAPLSILSSAGITPADYPAIVGADPFADASASPTPDPKRYVLITEAAYYPGPVTTTLAVYNATNVANSQLAIYSYSVNATVSTSDAATLSSLTDPTRFTWTHSSTYSNQSGSTAPITLTITPPAPYTGPTVLYVYLDTIYKTLMFSFTK